MHAQPYQPGTTSRIGDPEAGRLLAGRGGRRGADVETVLRRDERARIASIYRREVGEEARVETGSEQPLERRRRRAARIAERNASEETRLRRLSSEGRDEK